MPPCSNRKPPSPRSPPHPSTPVIWSGTPQTSARRLPERHHPSYFCSSGRNCCGVSILQTQPTVRLSGKILKRQDRNNYIIPWKTPAKQLPGSSRSRCQLFLTMWRRWCEILISSPGTTVPRLPALSPSNLSRGTQRQQKRSETRPNHGKMRAPETCRHQHRRACTSLPRTALPTTSTGCTQRRPQRY